MTPAREPEAALRAREAMRFRQPVHFDRYDIKEGLRAFLEGATGRSLAMLLHAEEVKGRWHYETGYVWSWRQGERWLQFAVFG